ncbi:MAG TPA: hypothetical protein QGF58_28660 [Myxococcota bacterium]|nr:hypothetical protein [Myxococcota bacterium]
MAWTTQRARAPVEQPRSDVLDAVAASTKLRRVLSEQARCDRADEVRRRSTGVDEVP